MVLMYGVDTIAGRPTCNSRDRSSSFINRKRARLLPRVSMTESSESTHSAVSAGSMSGSCCAKPSKITGSMLPGYGDFSAQVRVRGAIRAGKSARCRTGQVELGMAEPELATLAARQEGLVTRPQALAHLSREQIKHRLAIGRLVSVRWGMYRFAGAPPTPWQEVRAACLA